MNIHEAVLQPIAAFVYCHRHTEAGRRRQTKVGNFRALAGACATNSAHGRRSDAQAPAVRGNFQLLPAGNCLLLRGDYNRRMQRLSATLPHEYSC